MVLNSRGHRRAGQGEILARVFPLFPDCVIQAPGARAGGHQPQVEKAKDHRFFAAVVDGPETARRPTREIGHRHFAAQDKRRRAGEQPQKNEQPAGYFQRSREPMHRSKIEIDSSSRKAP